MGLALCLCLVTIMWCFVVLKNSLHQTVDRFLIGFIGLLSIYHGMHILESVGLLQVSTFRSLDNGIELVVTALYLIGVIVVKFSSRDRLSTMFQLRLADAQPESKNSRMVVGSGNQQGQGFGMERRVQMLRTAGMTLSDNAFKVFAYICLNADENTGLLNREEGEFMRALLKNRRSVIAAQEELITKGLCDVHFNNTEGTVSSGLLNPNLQHTSLG